MAKTEGGSRAKTGHSQKGQYEMLQEHQLEKEDQRKGVSVSTEWGEGLVTNMEMTKVQKK